MRRGSSPPPAWWENCHRRWARGSTGYGARPIGREASSSTRPHGDRGSSAAPLDSSKRPPRRAYDIDEEAEPELEMDIKGAPWPSRENETNGVVLHRTTVLTVSQRVASRADRSPGDEGRELSSGLAVAGGSVVLPGLRAEERLLLGLVDGRLSIARLARLSGLSEEATLRHLRTLCGRRVLVP